MANDYGLGAVDFNSIDQNAQDNIQTVKPINSGLVKSPNESSPGFWSTAADMTLSIPQGVVDGYESQVDWLDKNWSLGGLYFGNGDGKFQWSDVIPEVIAPKEWEAKKIWQEKQLPTFYKPKTEAGNLTYGISEFIGGFIGPSKLLKGVGVGGSLLKNTLRGFGAGAISDYTVFDPHEENLSNMLVQFDSVFLNNAVSQFLAKDGDDSEEEGRMKRALEGVVVGGLFVAGIEGASKVLPPVLKYPLMLGIAIKSIKTSRKAGDDLAKREEIYKETGELISDLKNGELTPRVKKAIVEGNENIDSKIATKAIKIGEQTAEEDASTFIKSIFNIKSFGSAKQVLKSIDDAAALFAEQDLKYLQSAVLKNETVVKLAKILSSDPEAILKALPQDAAAALDSPVRVIATKEILQKMGRQLDEFQKANWAKYGSSEKNWPKAVLEEVARQHSVLKDTIYYLKQQIRGAARTTQAGNIKTGLLDIQKLTDDITQYGGSTFSAIKNTVGKSYDDAEFIHAITKSKFQRSIDAFNSLYANSLVSGIVTNLVNITSGIGETILKPIAVMGGAAARRDWKTIQIGAAHYQGMILGYKEIWKYTSLAFRNGESILDVKNSAAEFTKTRGGKLINPLSAETWNLTGSAGTAADWFSKFALFPQRLLLSGDEIIKQTNYRGRLYSWAIQNTLERGLELGSKEAKANILKIMKEGFDETGKAALETSPFAKDALEYARQASFTSSLKDGRYLNIGGALNEFFNRVPLLRPFAIFIRTPTNIWRNFESTVPGLGLFSQQMKNLWATGDPKARAEVVGRQLLGTTAALLALDYATSYETVKLKDGNTVKLPKLTGAGPRDKDIKNTWRAAGWQPYSVLRKDLIGDGFHYVSYNRADPRFYIFGIIADIAEQAHNINKEDRQNLILSIPLSIMKNVTNKLYFKTISDTLDVLVDPTTQNFERYFGNLVGNAIPYAGLRSQGLPSTLGLDNLYFNQEAYDIRSFADSIISKVPLGGMALERKRDYFGNLVERNPSGFIVNRSWGGIGAIAQGPILVGQQSDLKNEDQVFLQLAALKIKLTPPEQYKDKIDLASIKNAKTGQTALDFWREQVGVVTVDGKKIHDYFAYKMQGSSWLNAQEGNELFDGKKELLAKTWYDSFKTKAWAETLKAYPEIKEQQTKLAKQQGNLLKSTTGTRLDKNQENFQKILLY